MFSWTLALPLAAVAWIVAVLYLWLVRRRQDETRAGMAALAGLHWRDFSALVRRALEEQRGWRSEPAPQQTLAPHADFLMQADHGTWMVSCKHGRAYRIGAAAVNELGAITRLAGASGGLLVTEGQVEREGLDAAGKQSIEVLDGRRLWPLLKPYLPGDIEDEVVGSARYRAQRHTGIAGLAALALGLLLGLGHRAAEPG
ncbi:restriction endonuclease, partial [Xanthomonas sp. Kuri4-2]